MNLTKTVKKGKESKVRLFDQIRTCATAFPHIYLFKVRNMRNVLFKELRTSTTGRFFIGKNKVMAVALGLDAASECVPGASEVARNLKGNQGVFFSNDTLDTVRALLDTQEASDYARTGARAEMTVVVQADPDGLRSIETGELLPATLETQLREAGMPTHLRGGSILLAADSYTICEEGDKLTASQSRLLKAFGIKMASFQVAIVGHLFDGAFVSFDDPFSEDEHENTPTVNADMVSE